MGVVDPANPEKPQATDKNVSVYVGGNFTRTVGSELEGRLVVDGNASFSGGNGYSMGSVGAGSGINPVGGTDMIMVGGDLEIGDVSRIVVATRDDAGTVLPGHVKIGGAQTGTGTFDVGNDGTVKSGIGRTAALGSPSFSDWPANDFSILRDVAERNETAAGTVKGSHALEWGTLTLTGDPGASRHLFEFDAATLNKPFVLNLGANIDPTEPVVIRMTGSTAKVEIQDTLAANTPVLMQSERFGQMASQILWTFPDATDVTLAGAQFPGTVVVPTAGSKTTNAAAGTNGRIWVAGDLTQDRAGSEFHNFPFIGDPEAGCEEPPTPTDPVDPTEPMLVTPVEPHVVQATCDLGEPTEPTVETDLTEGITYTVEGDIAAGSTVTVKATADAGTIFPATIDGWVVSEDRLSATKDIVLTTPECEPEPVEPLVVTPVAPEVSQATCLDGEATRPIVEAIEAEGITVKITGDIVAGNTVTVTATADKDHLFPASLEDWTISEDRTTATKDILLTTPECETTPEETVEVTPVAPSVAQATCLDGETTVPTIDLPETDGMTYVLEGEVASGKTVTVTATAQDGYVFPVTVEGWTVSEDRATATQEIVLTSVECEPEPVEPAIVTPVAPVVEQATCSSDGTTDPTVTPAVTEGISYSVSGTVAAGNTVTVTATADEATSFPAKVDGWVISEDRATATREIVLATPECETTTPVEPTEPTTPVDPTEPTEPSTPIEPTTVPGGSVDESGEASGESSEGASGEQAESTTETKENVLAATGASAIPLVAGGLILLLIGTGLVVFRRRGNNA
ncbi:choice-of-anchor A family protein [Paeniglutamicibacter sp. R2-26]|uniref:choice-of-anchor A family protein n=1 Tax=Paeniglutamicibacter sp. R2-26 TaxID=3144417 RepID=UPI003EE6F730